MEASKAHCANPQSKAYQWEPKTNQKRDILENCLEIAVFNSADNLSKSASASETF